MNDHLEQPYILFYLLDLLWLERCLMYLGMCGSVVIDVQCFRINRLAKMSRKLQGEFEEYDASMGEPRGLLSGGADIFSTSRPLAQPTSFFFHIAYMSR